MSLRVLLCMFGALVCGCACVRVVVFWCCQMMVAMKRTKWDGSTTGSSLTASVARVHDELKVLPNHLQQSGDNVIEQKMIKDPTLPVAPQSFF